MIRIAVGKALLGLGVVEHLVQEQRALLYPVELFRHLLLIVGLLLRFL